MKDTNKYIKTASQLLLIAVTSLFAACQMEEMEYEDPTSASEYISFVPSFGTPTKGETARRASGYIGIEEEEWTLCASPKASTRSSLTTAFTDLHAGVTGYVFESALTAESASWDKVTNKEYIFEDNAMVAAEGYVRWTDVGSSKKVRLYAYAPYMDLEVTEYTGAPTISYTLPDLAEDQKDIIAAVSADYPASHRRTIPMEFTHCLTAVRFRAGFDCTVKSIAINNVYSGGTYTIGGEWTGSGSRSFTAEPDKAVTSGELITDGEDIFMLIPQVLGAGAELVLTYDYDKVIRASLEGFEFKQGKLVTFTLNKEIAASEYIYFDLAAGKIQIGKTATQADVNAVTKPDFKVGDMIYDGYAYTDGTAKAVKGKHLSANKYYVYQTTEKNRNDGGIPTYPTVMYNGKTWAEYITNNPVVEDVIEAWDNKENTAGASVTAGRRPTSNNIHITGAVGICDLTIDNIYSRFQQNNTASRSEGGIGFIPGNTKNSTLKIFFKGDNRLGCIHFNNNSSTNNNSLILEGDGTLTVADANFFTGFWNGVNHGLTAATANSYTGNHWMSAIGNNDGSDSCYGIVINSGTIYAGTTKAENCTAIGGGGNGYGQVTIKGGNVTAVATTTGTAIGGGIGFNAAGGQGEVTVYGGNIYAYNHANRWNIPSSAIGGAGSSASTGNLGTVKIYGGNIYAQSALGTAIGGGSSASQNGGGASVTITGGHVVAKSIAANGVSAGAGIGGGSGCTNGTNPNRNGGTATIRISGNPIIRTGSIGGGTTKSPGGFIGGADIQITGGDIQAQFIMAAGSETDPVFLMNGGILRDSNVDDPEYNHISRLGGAVYMENGSFTMKGGTIKQCIADQGGAVYIKAAQKSTSPPKFIMEGGEIFDCTSTGNGGAIYLEDGSVNISGGKITNCAAENGGAIYILRTGSNVPSYTMSGGSIEKCNSHYNGGGIYLEGGDATLSGGSIIGNYASAGNGGGLNIKAGNLYLTEGGSIRIEENAAQMMNGTGGNGGGLYVSSDDTDVNVDLLSGTIRYNASNNNGGGVAIVMSEGSSATADVQVGTAGGSDASLVITNNDAANMGGGLYVIGDKAHVTMDSGTIEGNTTISYVYNEDVANEKGTVTLNGGKVASVNVVFHANSDDAYFINGTNPDDKTIKEAYQRIVTSTNSRLVPPENANRPGYTLLGWHSHKDGPASGTGKFYEADDIMNLSSSFHLYAIWTVKQ